MDRVETHSRFSEKREHPWVAVDVVIYTYHEKSLQALLVKIKEGPFEGKWAFPGGLIGNEESPDDAARREVQERTAVQRAYVEQLYTFGKPERDPATRAVSVSYFALVLSRQVELRSSEKYSEIRWFPADRLPSLAYDHPQVADMALRRLRAKLQYTNVVYSLLPREFTLSEVQEVYEAILCRRLDRRNFRKKVLALGILKPLRRVRRGAHRPASLYAFKERRLMVIEML